MHKSIVATAQYHTHPKQDADKSRRIANANQQHCSTMSREALEYEQSGVKVENCSNISKKSTKKAVDGDIML